MVREPNTSSEAEEGARKGEKEGAMPPQAVSERAPIVPAWPGNQPPLTHQNLSGGEQRHGEVTVIGTGDLLAAC